MKSIIVLLTSLTLLSGCMVTDYSVGYYLSNDSLTFKGRSALENEINAIEEIVVNVASKYGFSVADSQGLRPQAGIFLFKESESIVRNQDVLSRSNMSIFLSKDPKDMTLTVRDLDSREETSFMKALKAELEKELSSVIDMKGVDSYRLGTHR